MKGSCQVRRKRGASQGSYTRESVGGEEMLNGRGNEGRKEEDTLTEILREKRGSALFPDPLERGNAKGKAEMRKKKGWAVKINKQGEKGKKKRGKMEVK